MRRLLTCGLAVSFAMALSPATARGSGFAFGFDYFRADDGHSRSYGRMKADIEKLDVDVYYTGSGWNLLVRYKVEVKYAPVGQCEMLLELVDRDGVSPPVRVRFPLNQPTEYDGKEIVYSARTNTGIAFEHIRNPDRLRAYGYAMPVGGGPVLDRESTKVKYRR